MTDTATQHRRQFADRSARLAERAEQIADAQPDTARGRGLSHYWRTQARRKWEVVARTADGVDDTLADRARAALERLDLAHWIERVHDALEVLDDVLDPRKPAAALARELEERATSFDDDGEAGAGWARRVRSLSKGLIELTPELELEAARALRDLDVRRRDSRRATKAAA